MTKVLLHEIVECISQAVSLTFAGAGVDWGSTAHGSRVCYISMRLARQMKLEEQTCANLYYAAMLHDCGISTTKGLMQILQFETVGEYTHCEKGFALLNKSDITRKLAEIVLYHHDTWAGPNKSGFHGEEVPLCSRIIFIADRVDIILQKKVYVLHQREQIVDTINKQSGKLFDPEVVKALEAIAKEEAFWLNLVAPEINELFRKDKYLPKEKLLIDSKCLVDIAEILASIVDSKSEFTRQHSHRVALIAEYLAKVLGFSEKQCVEMKIAGLLHDIGKLSVPDEILDKQGALTKEEREIIEQHTYQTNRLLSKIKTFETINLWASMHHERIDGHGYPFRIGGDRLSLGIRILAVADVFTALAEDRPYRDGFNTKKICEILKELVVQGALDERVVDKVKENIDVLYNLIRVAKTDENMNKPVRAVYAPQTT